MLEALAITTPLIATLGLHYQFATNLIKTSVIYNVCLINQNYFRTYFRLVYDLISDGSCIKSCPMNVGLLKLFNGAKLGLHVSWID